MNQDIANELDKLRGLAIKIELYNKSDFFAKFICEDFDWEYDSNRFVLYTDNYFGQIRVKESQFYFIKAHEHRIAINITNEWGGTGCNFFGLIIKIVTIELQNVRGRNDQFR